MNQSSIGRPKNREKRHSLPLCAPRRREPAAWHTPAATKHDPSPQQQSEPTLNEQNAFLSLVLVAQKCLQNPLCPAARQNSLAETVHKNESEETPPAPPINNTFRENKPELSLLTSLPPYFQCSH